MRGVSVGISVSPSSSQSAAAAGFVISSESGPVSIVKPSIRYLRGKVGAGADAIQLFDSWVGALSLADYREFVRPYSERILASLSVPTIHFGTGTQHLLAEMAGDVLGIDWRGNLSEVLDMGRGAQGNLDGATLLGPFDRVEQKTVELLEEVGGRPGHIFNLGHGVLPNTPVDQVQALARFVHSFRL